MLWVRASGSSSLEAAAGQSFGGAKIAPYLVVLPVATCLELIGLIFAVRWVKNYWRQDSWRIRLLGIWMIICGLGFTVTQWARTVDIFVYNFGRYSVIYDQRPGRFLILFMCGAHSGSQAFYTYRAYLLSQKNKWMLGVFSTFWLAVVGLSVTSVVKWPDYTPGFTRSSLVLYILLAALSAAFDTTITCTILWLLYKRRAQSSDRNSESRGNRLIRKLMRLSVETQLPVSLFAIILAIADGLHDIYLYVTPICLACLCLTSQITLFMMLNGRKRLEQEVGIASDSGARAPSPERSMESAVLSFEKKPHRPLDPPSPVQQQQGYMPWLMRTAPGPADDYADVGPREDCKRQTLSC